MFTAGSLRRRAELADAIVQAAYREALAPSVPAGLALVAVGGYGRRELFPGSDVDLLILARPKAIAGEQPRAALADFLRLLWDRRLRLSHSVRTVADCCELHDGNPELNISLLDQRFLTGDESLNAELQERLPRFLRARGAEIARRLSKLARARHARFQNTIHHMEPDIKEAPGGIRDLHTIWWLERLRLPRPSEEWVALASAREFLYALRCFLHARLGRDANTLTFELQDEAAAAAATDPAEWMRHYFRHARAVHRTASRAIEAAEGPEGNLLAQFRNWRSRLSTPEFTVSRERVYLRSPAQLDREPELALRLFGFMARHGLRLAPETERRVSEARPSLDTYFAEGRPVWRAFTEILTLPHAALALRAMEETGALPAVLPEWKRIECLVVRDFHHRYTVDEHTVAAFDALHGLRATRHRFADLLEEVDAPDVLAFALLVHDIGKGCGDGRHTDRARPLVEAAMSRLQAPPGAFARVWALIAQHLALGSAASTRDLDDPATARDLAQRAGTEEQLRDLTLLTYADMSAVNPAAMSPWRLERLWLAYLCAHRELTRGLDADRIAAPEAPSPDLARFLEGLPSRYLRTHAEDRREAHLRMWKLSRETGAAVEIRRLNGVFTMDLLAKDRPGLFAALAGTLSGFGLNVVKAEAFANRAGDVLDSFVFTDPARNLELNPTEVDRLRLALERAARGNADVRGLLHGRPKPAFLARPRVRPSVTFDSEASAASTLVEIVAQDRPGLLYDLAREISAAGCNIEVVLVHTEAHKAVDVFYLTRGGVKLSPEVQERLKTALLLTCGP
ncbi:MAG: ACT domain-containing protein [Bryobacteraceae bacterium]